MDSLSLKDLQSMGNRENVPAIILILEILIAPPFYGTYRRGKVKFTMSKREEDENYLK